MHIIDQMLLVLHRNHCRMIAMKTLLQKFYHRTRINLRHVRCDYNNFGIMEPSNNRSMMHHRRTHFYCRSFSSNATTELNVVNSDVTLNKIDMNHDTISSNTTNLQSRDP